MSLQKELCLICELPTADGAIFAVHVDKERLQEWFLNVCGHELAEEILDEDKICYFCAWQAEFLWKFDGMSDEDLVWWPRNLDFDDAAKELRKYYFEGIVEQCWVQLEEVNLPDSEDDETEKEEAESESETHTNIFSEKKKCLYCGKLFKFSKLLSKHVKETHKENIRCENRNCATYFHTIEEREKHNEEVHEIPRKQKTFECDFCSKEFIGINNYVRHVRRVHREFPVKCVFYGCISFFKADFEMRAHFDSVHKNDDAKMIDCEYCDYKTKKTSDLLRHIDRKHLKKSLNCDKCGQMFPTNNDLTKHVKNVHTLKRCKICTFDVSVGYFTQHLRTRSCRRCKNKLLCSGLYQSHLKKCRETLLKCSKCPKSFQKHYLLVYHMKIQHRNREWRGLEHKALGFKCEHCKRYYKSAKNMKQHFIKKHNQANLKHCAHCPKGFISTSNLIIHLARKHNLFELEFECGECKNWFISKDSLRKHIRSIHLKNTTN